MAIQMRRGLKADILPLLPGEFGLCLDTDELFIGSGENENILMASGDEINEAVAQLDSRITAVQNSIPPFATQAEAEAGEITNKIMSPLRVKQQSIAESAAQIPTISGSAATRDLTVPAEANKNRLTILLSSDVTATSNIRLRIGTGAYYNLVWPKPGTAVNILLLLANTPYDLVFNDSAWVVKDYAETGNDANGSWTKYADGRMGTS